MKPNDLVHPRVGFDGTLEVHVVTFFNVTQVEGASRLQGGARHVCREG